MLLLIIFASTMLAAIPALLFVRNLGAYLPPVGEPEPPPPVSVLIPARNEERGIAEAVEAALANQHVDLEVIVLDDHSADRTAAIVREIAARDPRVRLSAAPELPQGWCGKQYACWTLANLASKPYFVFLDADVRLAPDALARMVHFLEESRSDLASGIPRQETVGLLEQTLIPLIHFIFLGFLPIRRMRASNIVGMGAGCGQLFITKKSSYELMGGHASVRATLHDGLKLPRAYRASGLNTDLFDATDLASCRMYRGASEVWRGLAKNAHEALAAPGLIVPATIVLFGGQVLPPVLLACTLIGKSRTEEIALAACGTILAYLPRIAGAWRFRQSWLGAFLHPLGVVLLLAIQWQAFARTMTGRPAVWKDRTYS